MKRLAGWLAMLAYLLALASAATWAVAWIATDRWPWTQWIWWFPWLGYAAACVPALFAGLLDRRSGPRRWRGAAMLTGPLVAAFGVHRDVGFTPRPAPGPGTLRIVQWNASWPGDEEGVAPSEAILALEGDLVVVSNPFRFLRSRRTAWAERGYDTVQTGTFAFASRRPILEARPLPAPPGCSLALVRIDAGPAWDRPFSVLAIDLPSDPKVSRMEVARRLAEAMPKLGLPPFDAVVGDFNITRGSASLALAFPDHREAFAEAGAGWGASFEEPRPLFHIDLLLAGRGVEIRWCRLWSVGPRHRAQETWIEPRPAR